MICYTVCCHTACLLSTALQTEVKHASVEVPARPTGLEELDVLGETLLKKNLPPNSMAISSFQKPPDKISLNVLAKQKEAIQSTKEPFSVGNSILFFNSIWYKYWKFCGNLFLVKPGDAISVRNPDPPLNFDLLMQTNIIDVTSPAVTHPTTSLLHAPSSDSEKLQDSSDVLMLGTGASTAERLNGNDDVQLLNSPIEVLPLSSVVTQKTAPPLADIILRLEDIKPSIFT